MAARIQAQSIAAAQGDVANEVLKIGAALPAVDWISQPFTAKSDDAMDAALELLVRKLAEQNKSLEGAAAELATGPLYPSRPLAEQDPECIPGLISGFDGPMQDEVARVVRLRDGDPGGSGDATGGGGGGAAGVGVGGSLGQFLNVDVTVHVADGPTFGPKRTDAAKGMVTFVPCDLRPPVHIKFEGRPGSGATYYDEERKELVSFEGQVLEGVAMRLDRNIGVTPFTDAIVRRARELEDLPVAVGGYPFAKQVKAMEGWRDPARLQVAHDEVRRAINDQLPGFYRLEDLTRLPVILNKETDTQSSSVLTDNQNGIYGAVIAGFVRSGAVGSIQNAPNPALLKARQFSEDMRDGRLDQMSPGDRSFTLSQEAYDVDTLWINATISTAMTSVASGEATLAKKRGIVAHGSSVALTGPQVHYFHSTTGLLTAAEYCEEILPNCPPKYSNLGHFKQVEAILRPQALAAISVDQAMLQLFRLTPGPGSGPSALLFASLQAPSGLAFESIKGGLIRLSNGAVWTIVTEGELNETTYRLVEIAKPASVAKVSLGYFSAQVAPSPLGSPLAYGLTTTGDIVVWNVGDANLMKTVSLPAPAVQLSTNQVHVLALTKDGNVFWVNPGRAQHERHTETESVVEPVYPEGVDYIAIDSVQNACWIAMPYVVSCEGLVSELKYSLSLQSEVVWGPIEEVVPRPLPKRIWRVTPQVDQFVGRSYRNSFEGRALAIDGDVYSPDGAALEIPEFALQ